MPEIVYLSGLPRSGSTLLCNLLAQHPEVEASPSSPLCHILQNMRRHWSDDPFLLAQLDDNFEAIYGRLGRASRAFMEAWCQSPAGTVVDKNRGWLWCLETLRELFPEFKMIVTLRDLRSVYTSIEKQHRRTLMLEFPDHLEHNLVDVRAQNLFADGGLVGGVLRALHNIGDVPDISRHLYFQRYEDLLQSPLQSLERLTNWLSLETHAFRLDAIEQTTLEADSYYRFKFPHRIESQLQAPQSAGAAKISPRILAEIRSRFSWFYDAYYPDEPQQPAANSAPQLAKDNGFTPTESRIAQEIEGAL